MNPRIEIDEIYKEMMAQKEQNVLCDDLLNRIDWIKKIKPDIRQAEINKLSVILIKELQRFSNWEEIKSDAVFIEELSNIIDMIATTEYVDGEQGNAYTECFRFLYHLSKKPDQNNVSDIVQQYWIFQDILPMIRGIFLLEKEDGTKWYPVYEMVIGMAQEFKCDNDHLLNLAIALQMFEKIAQYAEMKESSEIRRAISEIARNHNIKFLTFLIDGGKLMYDELDYKINGTLIVKKSNQIIIRNLRRDYFSGYFMEEEIISENDLAWYVIINLESDEEVTDLASIFEDKNQENKLELLKMIEKNNIFNVFIPNRILRNKRNQKITRFLNPASASDKVIVYKQRTEENEKDGFLKLLRLGAEELRGCNLCMDDYDTLTIDFFAAFYLEVVRNRWNFCTDLETGKDCFYQEYLMKKYLQESLQKADEEKAKNILDDFYNFIIQYFDFNKIDENSMMDGKLLAFPMINGFQKIFSEFFDEESIKNRIFSSMSDEWQCDIAKYQKKKAWTIGERKIRESDLLNTDFVNLTEINTKIPQGDLYVFVNKTDGKTVINTEFMDANRKIKKLSDISEFQMIMYEEKTLYMNDNLGRLLKLMEANDISHNKSELFQCEKRGRNSVYLYKALWHFQIFEMDQERIEKFWRLILQKHYLGMVEEMETIKQYFTDMQELAETDGILVLAKESYGNDSTLHYLYDKFEHIHGERSYLSWAFDEGKIKRYLKREEHTNIILWHGKPLKKIIFMVDNLMKGGSLRNMLNFHLAKTTDEESRRNIERDYLNIHPTVKEMLNEINDLQIEIHPIFGFKECVEAIEAEYPVKIVIHKEIPGDFYSDDETIHLVYELYDKRVDKGICCVFRYNNLPAKNVLPSYVCDYKKRVGLFQRSVDLV